MNKTHFTTRGLLTWGKQSKLCSAVDRLITSQSWQLTMLSSIIAATKFLGIAIDDKLSWKRILIQTQ